MATLFSSNSVSSSSSAMVFSDPTNTYEYNGQQVSIGNTSRNNTNIVQYTLCYEGVDPQSAQQTNPTNFSSINQSVRGNSIAISPNPAKDFIQIHNMEKLELIEFIAIDGRLIKRIQAVEQNGNLAISFLESGTYFLRFRYVDSREITKLIKQ